MQSLIPQILAPVMMQIVASHMAKDKTSQTELRAFVATIIAINLPLTVIALMYRITGSDMFLWAESRASASTILQMLYYFEYATNTWNQHGRTVLIAFLAAFMNETTMSGGDWFGHRVIVAMNLFFCLRILVGIAESKFGNNIMPVWNIMVLVEFCIMGSLSLLSIWNSSVSTPWFVVAFLVTVPIAFPTSNRYKLPSEASGGFLMIAPIRTVIMGDIEDDVISRSSNNKE